MSSGSSPFTEYCRVSEDEKFLNLFLNQQEKGIEDRTNVQRKRDRLDERDQEANIHYPVSWRGGRR